MRVSLHVHPEALPPAARALLAEAGERNLFSTEAWFANFQTTVVRDEGKVQFVVAGESEATPAAILPLWLKQLRRPWTARRLDALANFYCNLYEPITCADEARGRRGLDALADYLLTQRRDWDVIDLTPMDDDWRFSALREAFARRGALTLPHPAVANWYLDCPGMTFEEYFRSRGRRMRKHVRTQRKRLEQQYRLEMSVVTGGAELDAAMAHYDAVYAASWKPAEPFPEFTPGLMRSLAREGWLRLGVMLLDGRPAAAEACFVHGGTAYFFKSAYDPGFSDFQVGTLLSMQMFEHVLDRDHVRCIDFLGGDDEYKARWVSSRRERQGLEIIRRSTPRGAAFTMRRGIRALRRRLGRGRTQPA